MLRLLWSGLREVLGAGPPYIAFMVGFLVMGWRLGSREVSDKLDTLDYSVAAAVVVTGFVLCALFFILEEVAKIARGGE